MKQILYSLIFIISFFSNAQRDTMIVYYPNGQLKAVSPKLNGKPHGQSTMWYESGQLWSRGTWVNGKQVKTIMYYENGEKSYFTRYKKWSLRLKMWHPNGKRWTTSKSKYTRSIEKEFDSTGMLVRKSIERKGASLVCLGPKDSEISDSIEYKDRSCICSWGNVYWRNGVFIDEKGRDLNTNYSHVTYEYHQNGRVRIETTWNNESKQYIIREFDEKGIFITESKI